MVLMTFFFRFLPLALLIPQTLWAYPVKDIFKELKDRTFKSSPDKLNTESLSDEKQLKFQQSWTRFLPQVDLSFENRQVKDYSLINSGALGNDPSVTNLLQPQDANLYIWSLNLYLPLYRKELLTNYSLMKSERDLAQHNLSEFDQTHLLRLQEKYSQLLVSQFRIIAARNAIKKTEKNLEEVKLSQKMGQRVQSDVFRTESKLLNLRFQKAQSEQERLKYLHELEEVTGIDYDELLNITQINKVRDENDLMKAIAIFSESRDAMKSVRRFSPDKFNFSKSPAYQKLSLELEVDKTQLNSITDREHPEFFIQGSLYNQGGNLTDTIEGQKSHYIAVGVKMPIFNSGRTIFASKEKYLATKRKEREKEERIKTLVNDFSQKSMELQSRELMVQSLEASLQEAQRKLRVTERSYEFGKSTRVDILESIGTLLNQEVELARERTQLFNESQRFLWETGLL
jgi:outer membrane protein TolC